MKRLKQYATILTSTVLLFGTPSMATEFLQNGDFENGLNSWETPQGNGGVMTNSENGNRFAQYAPDGSSNRWDLQLFQYINLEAGKTYNYSFRIKTTSGNSRSFDFVVEKNGNPWTKHKDITVQVTDAWQTITGSFVAQASEQAKVNFMGATINGLVAIDDVSISDNSVPLSGLKLDPVLYTNTGGYGQIPPIPACNESLLGTMAFVLRYPGHVGQRHVLVVCSHSLYWQPSDQYQWIILGHPNNSNDHLPLLGR